MKGREGRKQEGQKSPNKISKWIFFITITSLIQTCMKNSPALWTGEDHHLVGVSLWPSWPFLQFPGRHWKLSSRRLRTPRVLPPPPGCQCSLSRQVRLWEWNKDSGFWWRDWGTESERLWMRPFSFHPCPPQWSWRAPVVKEWGQDPGSRSRWNGRASPPSPARHRLFLSFIPSPS